MTEADAESPAAVDEVARFLSDVRAIRRVVRMVSQRIGDESTQEAEATCKRLLRRLDLGTDHT
ncbi:MAG: hypothetical protein LBH48_01920, partial [Bifidobacteriaceae bacterium]|nr:hypothetical protein [Bifidobacteriaceae bacterium]